MNKVFGAIARYFKQTDRTLFFFSVVASLYGFVLVYSATFYYNKGTMLNRTIIVQAVAIVIGLALMILISKIDYHTLGNYWKIIAVLSILLLLYTFFRGKGRAGSEDRSWINVFGITIQPAEIVKVAFIFTFSKHYDLVKNDIASPKNVLLLGIHAAIPIGLILLTKDMGMMLVYVCIFLFMIFATPIKLRYFAGGAIALLIATPFIWNKVFGNTQRNRILALFDPTNPKYARQMFQQNQGISALASGEIWGYGLLKGPKTQSLYSSTLPERQNDMIFTVAGEELGFIGCIAIILVLAIILMRIIIDAALAKDEMGTMICVGAFAAFAIQIMINIGMCLRVLPVVGLALPFFSSGGTTTVSSFMTAGIVMSVFTHRKNLLFADSNDD